ncbi:hypothetical protein GGX14DRAFT_460864, partial [Mycena pura]
MQHKLLVSILISFLALTVSAAPVPAPVPDSILDREIVRTPVLFEPISYDCEPKFSGAFRLLVSQTLPAMSPRRSRLKGTN